VKILISICNIYPEEEICSYFKRGYILTIPISREVICADIKIKNHHTVIRIITNIFTIE